MGINFIRKVTALWLAKMADLLFLLDMNSKLLRKWQLDLLRFKISSGVRIGYRVYFKNQGNIEIGEHSNIGSFSKFWNYSPVKIGRNFLGAANLVVNTSTHRIDNLQGDSHPISIGDNVWCGINVTILGGVTIGNNVVIGACSMVNKDLPDNCVAFGCPAKPVKFTDRPNDFAYTPFKK